MVEEYGKNIPDDELKWSRIYGTILADCWYVLPAIHTAKQHIGKHIKYSSKQAVNKIFFKEYVILKNLKMKRLQIKTNFCTSRMEAPGLQTRTRKIIDQVRSY